MNMLPLVYKQGKKIRNLFRGKRAVYMVVLCMASCSPAKQPLLHQTEQVNVFVGTADDCGQLSPAASIPFGLVKLGPQTVPSGQAGYNYTAPQISGFTINRVEGVGCKGAGGNILVKPGMGDTTLLAYDYRKEDEQGSPGYYSVNFRKPAIKADITVTNATGWQQYTFGEKGKAWIMINLVHSLDSLLEEKHQWKANTISGSIRAMSVCKLGAYQFHYALAISKKADTIINRAGHAWYCFDVNAGETVDVQTAVSSIGPDAAEKTLSREIGSQSFAEIRIAADLAWNKSLAKISVQGKEEYVKLFYTHYYHTLLSPFKLSEKEGDYRGSDGKLYRADGFTYYHGWSLWDNFRTGMPLLTLTEPAMMNDICRSLTALYGQGKQPWATQTEPYPTVRTEHAMITLLDCYRKGIRQFDLSGVYPLLQAEAAQLPKQTPDQQLETAYDLWAMSKIAGITGHRSDSVNYMQQALAYRKTWLATFKVMNERSDSVGGDGLYEGTLWQYRWFVPFDYKGLQEMLGEQAFFDQLTYYFDHHLHNPANEPDISVPYLFNITSKPYKTQQLVNQLLTKPVRDDYATHGKFAVPYQGRVFKLSPQGYVPEMDDDAGTMAAWYVLSSIGLYPACVGEPVYWLSSPIFNTVTLRLPEGKSFTITAKNVSDQSFYIRSASLNGRVLNRCWITHQDIMAGGTLEFVLSDKPDPGWGVSDQWLSSIPQ